MADTVENLSVLSELRNRLLCSFYSLVLADNEVWPLRAILAGGITPWGGFWVNGDGKFYQRYNEVPSQRRNEQA